MHHTAIQHGRTISAKHGLGQLRREEVLRYKPPIEMELMRRIKAALKPKGLMNPGKHAPVAC
jgi:FAD/FMN-containing dehydrogenase